MKLLPDQAKTGTAIELADSAKLDRGIKGLGVYPVNGPVDMGTYEFLPRVTTGSFR